MADPALGEGGGEVGGHFFAPGFMLSWAVGVLVDLFGGLAGAPGVRAVGEWFLVGAATPPLVAS